MAKSTSTRMRERIHELVQENILLRQSADPELVSRLRDLEVENQSLKREIQLLNTELDEAFKEPQWFSHRGDWAVVVVVIGLFVSLSWYALKVGGFL